MKKLKKSLIILAIIVSTMSIAYWGTRWWLKYANTEAFKGEVNAAIITGIVTAITIAATLWMNWYTTYRSHRMVLRDEMFKKRIELYEDFIVKIREMRRLSAQFFKSPDSVNPNQIIELWEQIQRKRYDYVHLISSKAMKQLDQLRHPRNLFYAISLNDNYYFQSVLGNMQTELDLSSVIEPWKLYEILDRIYVNAYYQLFFDLGLNTIRIKFNDMPLRAAVHPKCSTMHHFLGK